MRPTHSFRPSTQVHAPVREPRALRPLPARAAFHLRLAQARIREGPSRFLSSPHRPGGWKRRRQAGRARRHRRRTLQSCGRCAARQLRLPPPLPRQRHRRRRHSVPRAGRRPVSAAQAGHQNVQQSSTPRRLRQTSSPCASVPWGAAASYRCRRCQRCRHRGRSLRLISKPLARQREQR